MQKGANKQHIFTNIQTFIPTYILVCKLPIKVYAILTSHAQKHKLINFSLGHNFLKLIPAYNTRVISDSNRTTWMTKIID